MAAANDDSQQYALNDPDWNAAVKQQESRGDPNAVSSAGALGTMQTLPSTLRDPGYGVAPAKDNSPAELERVGKDYRQAMFDKYKNPHLGAMAYNWGPRNVDTWIKNGANPNQVPVETKNYVKQVIGNYQAMKAGSNSNGNNTSSTVTPVSYNSTQQQKYIDPIDAALSGEDEKNLPTTSNSASSGGITSGGKKYIDPIDQALSEEPAPAAGNGDKNNPTQVAKAPVDNSVLGTAKDVAESIPTGIIQGANNITKVIPGAFNSAAQVGTQIGNKLHNYFYPDQAYTPEQQAANIKNAGIKGWEEATPSINELTGGTLSKAASGLSAYALNKLGVGSQNLTAEDIAGAAKDYTPEQAENALHQPQTGAGQVASNVAEAVPGGRVFGFKSPGVPIGAATAQQSVANTDYGKDNPLLQMAAGAIGGGGKSALKAIGKTAPEDIASSVLQSSAKGAGGNALRPEDINLDEIIPGSKPTLAEATGNPNIAVAERQQDRTALAANEATRETARKQYFEQASGTPQDIQAMKDERESTSTPLYEQAETQALDPTAIHPVLAKIDAAIEQVGDGSDAGKTLAGIRDKITNAMPTTGNASSGLLDSKGNPITTPGKPRNTTQSPMVQIYREARDALQKPATADGAYAGTVKSVIAPIVSDLGSAIESQSSAFAKAQNVYRTLSPKIDASEWMQGLKLTDSLGNFTLAKVKNALENAKKAQTSPSQNAVKNLAPEQLQSLQNLHDDLLRRNTVAGASMPKGSPTVQNAIANKTLSSGLMGKANGLMGGNAPRVAGAAIGEHLGSLLGHPGIGAGVGEMIGNKIGQSGGKKVAVAAQNFQNYLLNPEDYKQYLMDNSGNGYFNRFKNNLYGAQ